MLKVEGISKNFFIARGTAKVLEGININISKGEFISIVGPSGCGKSTLLNVIAGLEQPTAGTLWNNGKQVKGPGPDRVVMFQDAALFPWLKVIENVEYGMKVAGLPKKERRERAIHYLKMVHLNRFAFAYPHELSGGMRQRVALARALAIDSDILLMDEPFAALDAQTRALLHGELQQIWQSTGKTIIFVTHNVEEAVLLADRVIIMAANPGRIKREFPVPLSRPRNIHTGELADLVNQITVELKEDVEQVARAEFDGEWALSNRSFIPRGRKVSVTSLLK